MKKFLTSPTIEVCPPLFLNELLFNKLIQSIGKVSNLPTYSKKSSNAANKIKKKKIQKFIHLLKKVIS